jgi:cobalt-zinc-cadmium efflux system membrane fusion protein
MTHATTPAPAPARTPTPRRRRGWTRRLLVAGPLLLAAAVLAYATWRYPGQIVDAFHAVAGPAEAHAVEPETQATARLVDGQIELAPGALEALGLKAVPVEPQTRPIPLELFGGLTEYDENTRARIRPLFKGRVDRVHTEVGRTVRKGDPLVDLYSTELAEAKNSYEIEYIQWVYDRNLLAARKDLLKTKAVSEQLVRETENNEMKSQREYEVARDKLLVYGLSDEEIERIKDETGAQKARMTLRAPADGIVIERNVVPGNLYDPDDTLLVIAPLDRLWVWGSVFESDLKLVEIGQAWEIRFPFLDEVVLGKVDYIANRVDPVTRAVRLRTTIPNPSGRLKSDMAVQGALQIPPRPGCTVVPRAAVVIEDGRPHVYVQVADDPPRFERRQVDIEKELAREAIVTHGLRPGESVVSVGALLLAQIAEDLGTNESGTDLPPAPIEPAADHPPAID